MYPADIASDRFLESQGVKDEVRAEGGGKGDRSPRAPHNMVHTRVLKEEEEILYPSDMGFITYADMCK